MWSSSTDSHSLIHSLDIVFCLMQTDIVWWLVNICLPTQSTIFQLYDHSQLQRILTRFWTTTPWAVQGFSLVEFATVFFRISNWNVKRKCTGTFHQNLHNHICMHSMRRNSERRHIFDKLNCDQYKILKLHCTYHVCIISGRYIRLSWCII